MIETKIRGDNPSPQPPPTRGGGVVVVFFLWLSYIVGRSGSFRPVYFS
jgi:hypothetical protein